MTDCNFCYYLLMLEVIAAITNGVLLLYNACKMVHMWNYRADKDRMGVENLGCTPKCIVCYDAEVSTVLRPCNHVVMCHVCAQKWNTHCPVCCTPILDIETAYIMGVS